MFLRLLHLPWFSSESECLGGDHSFGNNLEVGGGAKFYSGIWDGAKFYWGIGGGAKCYSGIGGGAKFYSKIGGGAKLYSCGKWLKSITLLLQDKSSEMNDLTQLAETLASSGEAEGATAKQKVEKLRDQWNQIQQLANQRIKLALTYVAFHKKVLFD